MLSLASSIAGLLLAVAGICIILGPITSARSSSRSPSVAGCYWRWPRACLVHATVARAASGFSSARCFCSRSSRCSPSPLPRQSVLVVRQATGHRRIPPWAVAGRAPAALSRSPPAHAGAWPRQAGVRFPRAFACCPRGLTRQQRQVSVSVYLVSAAPLLVVLVVGNFGKLSYRKQERKGLANV